MGTARAEKLLKTPDNLDPLKTGYELRGRMYWISEASAAVHNYSYSYGCTLKVAAKALKLEEPEEDIIYLEYLRVTNEGTDPEADKRYLRCRLWNIIDSPFSKGNEKIQAMEMILTLYVPGAGKSTLRNLSFEQLLELVSHAEK